MTTFTVIMNVTIAIYNRLVCVAISKSHNITFKIQNKMRKPGESHEINAETDNEF